MRRRGGAAGDGADVGGGHVRRESVVTRAVDAVFAFVRLAEFEILFFVFLLVAFLAFKDLVISYPTSRPEYNQLLVKKPGGSDFWN